MKIVADENIPHAEALFSSLGELVLKPGRSLSASEVNDADALVLRSVTKVNASLLESSQVRFVGTCTIGTDHLDVDYLTQRGVAFASAPGCNANAVVQYVVCALSELGALRKGAKVAIIGCGNVGSRVYRALTALGLDCVGIDPYLKSTAQMRIVPFEAVYEADIICMHTPLVQAGPYPTAGLINLSQLSELKKGAVLLNAGRGECIDNSDLLRFCQAGGELRLVLDVWENEPDINVALVDYVDIATPHIAGYSFEGKINGATMVFRALARHLGREESWINARISDFEEKYFGPEKTLTEPSLAALCAMTYRVHDDHRALVRARDKLPASFDHLRKHYPMRREFSHYRPVNADLPRATLESLGFNCV